MKRLILLVCILISIAFELSAQKVKISNKTKYEFQSIVVQKEREIGRHYQTHIPLGARGYTTLKDYETPPLEIDTIKMQKRIKIKDFGKYTFEFIINSDSSLFAFDTDVQKRRDLILNEDKLVLGTSKDTINKCQQEIIFDGDCPDLFFDFKNRTDLSIYAIYPRFKDEKEKRGNILFNNPEMRLLPGETRKLLVSGDKSANNYRKNPIIEFDMLGKSPNGELIQITNLRAHVDDESISISL